MGSTTVICTDKTGTLTKNEMAVTCLVLGERIVEVTGEGYAPVGEFLEAGSKLSIPQPALQQLLLASVLCNDAALKRQGGDWQILGDPRRMRYSWRRPSSIFSKITWRRTIRFSEKCCSIRDASA